MDKPLSWKTISIHREFLLSLAVHSVVLAAAIVFGSQLDGRSAQPVVVYLSDEMPGGNSGSGPNDIGFQLKKGKQGRFSRIKHITKATAPEKLVSIDRTKTDATEQSPDPVPDASLSNNTTNLFLASDGVPGGTSSVGGGSGTSGGGGFGSTGTGGRGGSGGGTGAGHGTGSGDRNVLSEQYLAEHYRYIRDLIMKHLRYPQLAKKMGWKGKVVVSFLIKENGYVERSKIVSGSGYEVLDNNVLTAIKEVQPFPKPPIKAELVIPVTYKLE
ncbi:MAG TPA: energy transducer TonB [Syntrophorhabdaceae bacterium]|nr:energy transducer TonB [Syntrophorhabdaceae bacterium]